MLRFADKFDYFLMIIGTFGGLALGVCAPIFILFWGQFTDVFGSSVDQIVIEALKEFIKFIYLGIGTLILGWLMIAGWLITG